MGLAPKESTRPVQSPRFGGMRPWTTTHYLTAFDSVKQLQVRYGSADFGQSVLQYRTGTVSQNLREWGTLYVKQAQSAVCTLMNGLALLALVVSLCPDAQAVPSFTRQTGLVCSVCHNNPPELTAFGRKFKLEGYTLTDTKPDTTIDDKVPTVAIVSSSTRTWFNLCFFWTLFVEADGQLRAEHHVLYTGEV